MYIIYSRVMRWDADLRVRANYYHSLIIGKFCQKYSDFEGTKHCKKEEAVEVKKEIEDISSDTPEEVELETNDEFNKNVQEEEIIKPKALIKKSKR